ncbi:hypothetical protein [Marinigracilibium pacificum]|uniref:Uncharacterized protein n=1 Tax=Marinigracilibium pacificum TaxID=2729599 RepID=A0A848J6P6_9BACT|nr:hypothetical protein [Marinigracilibium pacificum]NMM50059.1 hypothetical protein [Marinigracilibium pacificum]
MSYESFLSGFHSVMYVAMAISLAFALGVVVINVINLARLKDPKLKYDYISSREKRMYTYFFIGLGAALFFYMNTLFLEPVTESKGWIFIRMAVALCAGTLIGYIPSLLLKYMLPANQKGRLKKLRFQPRISPKSGKKMRLLTEQEEDVHLDEAMQAEENIFSVDYDVWVDDDSDYVKIEKYPGHLVAEECDRCGMQTLKLKKEEILKQPTEDEPGEIIKHYKCSYCNRVKHENKQIAQLAANKESFFLRYRDKIGEAVSEKQYHVQLIKMEVYDNDGHPHHYEFGDLDQARSFLKELDSKNKASEE